MDKPKEKDKYDFGKCKTCGEEKTLKNGYCIECENFPDIFKDMFGGFYDSFI